MSKKPDFSNHEPGTSLHKGHEKIPTDRNDNYSDEIIHQRHQFLNNFIHGDVKHIRHYSFPPELTKGNIENFIGIAQVPLGLAGPLLVRGEHAQGNFLIPMCTTEGALIASYNRGIKILNLSGGVKTTVFEDQIQRTPMFMFDSSRECRDFMLWIDENMDQIRTHAESTSTVARLLTIKKITHANVVHLRFNYSTGDAAGQNMVTMATFVACKWIVDNFSGIRDMIIDANLSCDKKSSFTNTLITRGKRVTAEVTVKREVLNKHLRITTEKFAQVQHLASLASFVSGSNNNGGHSVNGLTAIFIATGQDVANVVDSSAAVGYAEVNEDGDLYAACTLPSLIVATHGGGTGLPTQRECLEIMDCYGTGKARKFAEIVAGVVLAGELSILSAMASSFSHEFVMSHEKHGRNKKG